MPVFLKSEGRQGGRTRRREEGGGRGRIATDEDSDIDLGQSQEKTHDIR